MTANERTCVLGSVLLTINVRLPRVGDGPGLARTSIDSGHAYADRAGADIQVPEADGLAAWLEAALVTPADDVCVFVADHNDDVVGFVLGSLARPVPDAAKPLLQALGQVRLVVDALAVELYYVDLTVRRAAWLTDQAYQIRLLEQVRTLVAAATDTPRTRLTLDAVAISASVENARLTERDEARIAFRFRVRNVSGGAASR